MSRTIEVIVTPTVETKGFSGSESRDASRFVERALGKTLNEQLTSEFYTSQSQQQHQREGQ